MEIQEDSAELFKFLNNHKVQYIIVGSYALAFHGVLRYTGDIDLYVKPDIENAQMIIKALREFGFGSLHLNAEYFTIPNRVIQIGVPPVRVDLPTSLTDIDWRSAFKGAVKGAYENQSVYFIGKKQYVQN